MSDDSGWLPRVVLDCGEVLRRGATPSCGRAQSGRGGAGAPAWSVSARAAHGRFEGSRRAARGAVGRGLRRESFPPEPSRRGTLRPRPGDIGANLTGAGRFRWGLGPGRERSIWR